MNTKFKLGCVIAGCSIIVGMYVMSEDSALHNVVGAAKTGAMQATTAPEKMLLTPEQRAKRIDELRSMAANSEIKLTPQEVQEAFFEYMLIQCADLFQGLADALGEGVTKVSGDVKAGEAVKRLPAAFADGVYLTFHLIRTMANKEYLDALKSLRAALHCMSKKSARTTSECSQYSTLPKSLVGVFTYVPKVLTPVAQATVLGITVGDRKVRGLVPLGISVVDPDPRTLKNVDIVTQLINIMLAFTDQMKHMEEHASISNETTLSSTTSQSSFDQITPASAESNTTITAQEEAEYKKIAEKNAQAKQIFQDLQVFAALSHELSKLFPEERTIKGITIPLREMLQAAIACLYNIAELGFGVIKIIDEQAQPMSMVAFCLRYTNPELKAAFKDKNFVDEYIAQCAPVGCRNKKECIAKMLVMVVENIKLIFDAVLVKYDPKTQTSQRGLLMNIDIIVDRCMKILLSAPTIQDALNKIDSKGVERAVDFAKKITSLRTLIKFFGQSLSGIMQAFIFAAAQLDFNAVPPEILQEYPEVSQEGAVTTDFSDEDIEKMFAELNYK